MPIGVLSSYLKKIFFKKCFLFSKKNVIFAGINIKFSNRKLKNLNGLWHL